MFNDFSDRQKEEQRVLKEGRLPPGQSLTQKFPVLHYGSVPSLNLASWNFRIWGEVDKPVTWSWDDFQQLPRNQIKMDLHCVTRWSKFDTIWEGVSVRQLIEHGLVKPKKTAHFVLQHAEYGFTVNLPLEVVLQENFLLATHFNGEPLTPEHGYPLRGVVGAIPGRDELIVPYLWKGAKWLRGLEFLAVDKPGFWEEAGYHNEGDVWKEQRLARR